MSPKRQQRSTLCSPTLHMDSLLVVPADGGFALVAISSSSAAGRQLHLWTAPAEGSSSVSPAGLWRQLPLWPHAAPTSAPSAATCTVSDMGAPAAGTAAGGTSCFAVAFPRSDMSGQWLACAALEAASPGEQVYPPNVAWLPAAATQQQRSRHSSRGADTAATVGMPSCYLYHNCCSHVCQPSSATTTRLLTLAL